ncbi:HEPN domain-containing protein [Synechococcus sp. HK05]|uniref:HEPN domain-containing protein n=1 Tax=Synechococcus sp. HK05 TaxID=2725975 RepID=UPI001C38E4B2|nr:HEPN domain-containing protein [Synechococcus sp. HK05]MBV2352299.1 HEPN domain-containing protein [Synechococcus sp. HK05]
MAEADALAMLKIARRDLQAAQAMLDSAAFHEAVLGFQLQQTLEKALKASLYFLDECPPFPHDLVALLKLLERAGVDISGCRELARFTDFAVQIRYDEQPDLQGLDRSVWNVKAEALVLAVEALLPPTCAGDH